MTSKDPIYTIKLTKPEAKQLQAFLKYAYKTYTAKTTINENTELALLNLISTIKHQIDELH